MTEKEFRKLKSLDLIQILLVQGNEEAKLQEELNIQKDRLARLRECNEGLKDSLNDKDVLIETLKKDLNQSDTEIQILRNELKELHEDKTIRLEDVGSLTEAAKRINHIFETAQREAEEYLTHPERADAVSLDSNPDEKVTTQKLPVMNMSDTDNITAEAEKPETTDEPAEDKIIDMVSVTETRSVHTVEHAGEDSHMLSLAMPPAKNWFKRLFAHIKHEKSR